MTRRAANVSFMTPVQRMRMRRFEVVCQRALARIEGNAEPDVQEVAANSRVIPLMPNSRVRFLTNAMKKVRQTIARVLRIEWISKVARRRYEI